MTTTQTVNREEVKMLALNVGVRAAARQLGLNEGRVLQWSKRGNWFKPTAQPPRQGDVITVIKPAAALAAAIANDSTPTRYALSKAHRKAAEHAQDLSGEELMDAKTAQALRQHGQGAALVHGWEAKQEQGNVIVNIALLGIDPSTVTMRSSATDGA